MFFEHSLSKDCFAVNYNPTYMKKRYLIGLGFALGCSTTQAQMILSDTIQTSVIVTDEPQTTDNEVIRKMYEANGEHFQDPRAPRFLFMDRKGKVALGIGGYVKGTMSVDMGGISDNLDFVTADIPAPSQPDMRNQFQMDASTSRLFLKLVGDNTAVGDFTVYVETDFRGKDGHQYDLRLRQAYIRLGNFLFGKTRSTFADGAAGPPTIDFEGPSGSVSKKNTMIQYRQQIDKHWSFAASIESPSESYTVVQEQSEAINQRIPDIPAYLQYQWDGGRSHIRLSGLFRALSYRNLVSAENKYAIGWAAQLSGMIAFSPRITFYYQAAYGRGYADYLNDLDGSGYDLIPDGDDGRLTAPYALGIVSGLQYNICKNFFVSASFSQCRLYDQASLDGSAYKYGQYVVANAFYSPFSNCQVGLEYLYGNRHNFDRTSGDAHRINAMIQYNF